MRLCLLLLLVFHSIDALAGGLSTWNQTTPGGNEVWFESAYPNQWNYILCGAPSPNSNVSETRDEGVKISRWYFYRQYIIGTSNDADTQRFFVFDEVNCNMTYFQTETEFEVYLSQHQLIPKIWTRWHDSYYGGMLYSNVNGLAQLTILLKQGAVIILCMWFLFHLIRSKFAVKSIRNQLFVLLLFALAGIVLLDVYPQSI